MFKTRGPLNTQFQTCIKCEKKIPGTKHVTQFYYFSAALTTTMPSLVSKNRHEKKKNMITLFNTRNVTIRSGYTIHSPGGGEHQCPKTNV